MIKKSMPMLTALLLSSVAGTVVAQDADYPIKALREHREGTSYYKVTVGADGRAKTCTITQSSGSDDLDQESCRMVIARARWTPEKNAEGEPIETEYSGKVRWAIPSDRAPQKLIDIPENLLSKQ